MNKKINLTKKLLVVLLLLFASFTIYSCNDKTKEILADLQDQIDELKSENTSMQARLDELETAKTSILQSIAVLVSKDSTHEERLTALETAKDSLLVQVTNLSELASTTQTQVTHLEELVSTLTTSLTDITSRTSQLETQLEALTNSVSALEEFASSAAPSIANYGERLGEIETKLGELDEELSLTNNSILSLVETVEEINEHLDLVDTYILDINGEILSITGELVIVDGHLQTLDGQIVTVSGDIDGINGTLVVIDGRIDSVVSTVNLLDTKVSTEAAITLENISRLLEDLDYLYLTLFEPFLNPYGYATLKTINFQGIKPIEVHDSIEFLQAIKTTIGTSSSRKKNIVIKLMADMDLGDLEVQALASEKGIQFNTLTGYTRHSARPTQHPKLIRVGVGQIGLNYVDNLLIYSDEGYAIRHVEFQANNATNIIFRNISFEELWEWDESSKGMFNNRDWDYFQLTSGSVDGFWVDHCSFQNAYDGIIDGGSTLKNLTVSWTELRNHRNPYIKEQIDELDRKLSECDAPGDGPNLKPLFWEEIRAKINNTPGLTEDDVIEFFASIKKGFNLGNSGSQSNYNYSMMTITYHHIWAENIQERFLRLRKADAHMYNIYNNGTSLYNMLPYFHFENMAMAPTEGSNIVLENSHYVGIDDPVRANQNMGTNYLYTGKFKVINSRYQLESVDYQGDSHTGSDPWISSSNRYPDFGSYYRNYKQVPYNYEDHMADTYDVEALMTGGTVGAGKLKKFNWQYMIQDLGWDGTFEDDYSIDNAPTFNSSNTLAKGRIDLAIPDVTRVNLNGTFTPANPDIYNFYNGLHNGAQSTVKFVKDVDYTLDVDQTDVNTAVAGFYEVIYTFYNLHDPEDVVVLRKTVQVVDPADGLEFGTISVSPVRDGYVNVTYTSINPSSNNAAKVSSLYGYAASIETSVPEDIVSYGSLLAQSAGSTTLPTAYEVYVGANDILNLVLNVDLDFSSVVSIELVKETVKHVTTPDEFKEVLFKSPTTQSLYVILDNDIDFTGKSNKVSEVSTFMGTLDGNGFKVTLLTTTSFGLFRVLQNASIKNITFDNV
ncbi:MAG: hypothetical protein LBV58_04725, partial [Acholeplasmatales bacterium]|nr:hypothetical protein [Acholeplasmatales bacterium]